MKRKDIPFFRSLAGFQITWGRTSAVTWQLLGVGPAQPVDLDNPAKLLGVGPAQPVDLDNPDWSIWPKFRFKVVF